MRAIRVPEVSAAGLFVLAPHLASISRFSIAGLHCLQAPSSVIAKYSRMIYEQIIAGRKFFIVEAASRWELLHACLRALLLARRKPV